MKRMRKCNDEVHQVAKDQALVKKLRNKRFRPFFEHFPIGFNVNICPAVAAILA
jgi:hypothetical protein